MKAKNLIRISLFAALLCMITILGAFAAEDTAKIFRFDGMGNMPVTVKGINNGDNISVSVTKDGTYRIEATKAYFTDANGNFQSKNFEPRFEFISGIDDEFNFLLNDYPYIKIKYRTNYPKNLQFYVTRVNSTNSDATKAFYIFSSLDKSQDNCWITRQYSLNSENANSKSYYTNEWDYGIKYTGDNGGNITCTEAYPDVFFPSSEKNVKIVNEALYLPFFQFKSIDEAAYNQIDENEIIYAEIEYVAFFSSEAEMNAYNGETSEDHAKIIAWDGNQNIEAAVTPTVDNAKATIATDTTDGTYKITAAGHNDSITAATYFRYTINVKDKFNLYDYPYAKTEYKGNYGGNAQWYINVPEGGYIYNSFELAGDDSWKINSYKYPNADGLDISDATATPKTHTTGLEYKTLTWGAKIEYSYNYNGFKVQTTGERTTEHFPTKDSPIPVNNPFFQIKLKDISAANAQESLEFNIKYVAFFDNEKSMNAYGTEAWATAETEFSNTIATILARDYAFIKHPASTEKDVENYVLETVNEMLGDGMSADIESISSYADKYYNVRLNISGVTASKTIGINVKITELADITPTVKGAQTRTDDTFGLRFGFTYNHKLDTTGYGEISYGALIALKNLIGENAITLENVDKILLNEEKIIANVPKVYNLEVKDAEEYTLYTAVITDFDEDTTTYEAQCDVKFVAVPYVTYKVGEETFTAYGKQIERSVNDVKDISGWSTDEAE